MLISITGAQFNLNLNDKPVAINSVIKIKSGDILTFGKLISGARAYLSVSHSIKVPKVFNSYATHLTANFGGFNGRAFKQGDKLETQAPYNNQVDKRSLPKYVSNAYLGSYILRCTASVETDLFTNTQIADFFNKKYIVNANSNRMGIRLNESALVFKQPIEITSSGLMQGSIQITPTGLPVISSVDGQTIGGYPRIANVITADLPLLGQLKAGDKVSFIFIPFNSAKKILAKQIHKLSFLNNLNLV